MPTLREWKERRPASDIKQTVEFYHPAFGYYRVVNNLFRPATFGGNSFEPARFSVTEPAQDGTAVISMTITFVAATEHVRQTLKSWRGAARMTPIKCLYSKRHRRREHHLLRERYRRRHAVVHDVLYRRALR